jgi:metal-responsive CopG/Arc/MetJ family transcriptional regulator
MAPPRIGTAVLVRIPDDLLARLDFYATDNGISRAEAIRHALTHYVRTQL